MTPFFPETDTDTDLDTLYPHASYKHLLLGTSASHHPPPCLAKLQQKLSSAAPSPQTLHILTNEINVKRDDFARQFLFSLPSFLKP